MREPELLILHGCIEICPGSNGQSPGHQNPGKKLAIIKHMLKSSQVMSHIMSYTSDAISTFSINPCHRATCYSSTDHWNTSTSESTGGQELKQSVWTLTIYAFFAFIAFLGASAAAFIAFFAMMWVVGDWRKCRDASVTQDKLPWTRPKNKVCNA